MTFKRFRFSAQHVRYLRLQYWHHPPLFQSGWICIRCPVLLSTWGGSAWWFLCKQRNWRTELIPPPRKSQFKSYFWGLEAPLLRGFSAWDYFFWGFHWSCPVFCLTGSLWFLCSALEALSVTDVNLLKHWGKCHDATLHDLSLSRRYSCLFHWSCVIGCVRLRLNGVHTCVFTLDMLVWHSHAWLDLTVALETRRCRCSVDPDHVGGQQTCAQLCCCR